MLDLMKLAAFIVLICFFPPLTGQPAPASSSANPKTTAAFIAKFGVLIFNPPLTEEEKLQLSGSQILPPTSNSCSVSACAERCKEEDKGNNQDMDSNEDKDQKNEETDEIKLVAINRLSEDTNYDEEDVLSEIQYADIDNPRFISTEDEVNLAKYDECGCICLPNLNG